PGLPPFRAIEAAPLLYPGAAPASAVRRVLCDSWCAGPLYLERTLGPVMIPTLATHVPRAAARFFPDLLWRVRTDARTVYLTFDDGPTTALTLPLLELLDRFNARASFFLLGKHAALLPDAVREIAAAGHTIGNHTYTHPGAWLTPA